MKNYLDLLADILENGDVRDDRTGTGTKSVFGRQLRFDLSKGFPLVTTKKMGLKSIYSELLWFLSGSTDERHLAEILYGTRDPDKKTIWTENAQADYWKNKAEFEGDLGRVYGAQWRSWKTTRVVNTGVGRSCNPFEITCYIDQIKEVINSIKTDPWSRRHFVVAYNPGEIDQICLPPCHVCFQFWVSSDRKLSCQFHTRSTDQLLGAPFNIASYAILTHLIAQVCGLGVGELIGSFGDAHIYSNHFDQVREQLTREPYPLPTLWIDPTINDIDGFTMDSIKLINYQCHPRIIAPMAV